MRDEQEQGSNAAISRGLTDKPTQSIAMAARQSTKGLLLERAEHLRRQANRLESLAYAVEHIRGDAEGSLYEILSDNLFRR